MSRLTTENRGQHLVCEGQERSTDISKQAIIDNGVICSSDTISVFTTVTDMEGELASQEFHSTMVSPKNCPKTASLFKENMCRQCCIKPNCSEKSINNKQLTVMEHLELMLHDIKLLQAKESAISPAITKLANTLVLLNFIKYEIYGEHFNPQNSFPVQLLDKYLKTVEGSLSKNHFDIPCKRETALCIMSDWLGKQFHGMESAVSVKVDQFKKDHISCIDNLPPSENIIKTLFPVSMTQLVSNWIGLNSENVCADVSDHDYGPPEKRIRGAGLQDWSLYPVIQLLLEFANNSLVSGVAHVVYSTLRHS